MAKFDLERFRAGEPAYIENREGCEYMYLTDVKHVSGDFIVTLLKDDKGFESVVLFKKSGVIVGVPPNQHLKMKPKAVVRYAVKYKSALTGSVYWGDYLFNSYDTANHNPDYSSLEVLEIKKIILEGEE